MCVVVSAAVHCGVVRSSAVRCPRAVYVLLGGVVLACVCVGDPQAGHGRHESFAHNATAVHCESPLRCQHCSAIVNYLQPQGL